MIRYLQREIEKLIIVSIFYFLYYTKNYSLVEANFYTPAICSFALQTLGWFQTKQVQTEPVNNLKFFFEICILGFHPNLTLDHFHKKTFIGSGFVTRGLKPGQRYPTLIIETTLKLFIILLWVFPTWITAFHNCMQNAKCYPHAVYYRSWYMH